MPGDPGRARRRASSEPTGSPWVVVVTGRGRWSRWWSTVAFHDLGLGGGGAVDRRAGLGRGHAWSRLGSAGARRRGRGFAGGGGVGGGGGGRCLGGFGARVGGGGVLLGRSGLGLGVGGLVAGGATSSRAASGSPVRLADGGEAFFLRRCTGRWRCRPGPEPGWRCRWKRLAAGPQILRAASARPGPRRSRPGRRRPCPAISGADLGLGRGDGFLGPVLLVGLGGLATAGHQRARREERGGGDLVHGVSSCWCGGHNGRRQQFVARQRSGRS